MAREDLQRIQELGFRSEVTEGTSPITVAVPPINFGMNTTSLGMLPRLLQDIIPSYKGGSMDPYTLEVARRHVVGQIGTIPTNSLLWFYAYGSASSGGAGIHDLVGINSADLPSASYRYETSNEVQFHRKDAVGNKMKRLALSIDLSMPDNVLTENFTFIGRNLINEASLTDNQNIPPVWADGDTLASQKGYRMDDTAGAGIFWDTAGDNINIKNYLFDFNYIMDTTNRSRFIQGQDFAKWVATGVRTHVLAFKMIRSDITDVFEDYILQTPNDSFKNMSFKIFNKAGKYRDYTFSNVAIKKCDMNYAILNEGQEPFYDVEAVVQSSLLSTIDDVPASLYGY